ncbi:Tetratricopeptide repeat-containing protein [Tenacibaculum sp. MAR_2010_89]|uniref:helix-turn-helix domain-containing protein n=1 Tax=Tenacibaculum sp. MAR_2010_89 TaxID=1250198 RepID=UPI0008984497|nr:helix-turn-helix domain-containing protein [Tenacibaculum sp. MAR_2010_89]SED96391.1 Tetratricopeptide repeat-containing protein [Tenacibaculum sp. MAR_2010_89]
MKYLKVIILYFLFFCAVTISAQEFKDSIYKKELIQLSDSLQNSTEIRKSISFMKKMLFLAEKNKDTFRIIQFLHTIGRRSQFISENHSSIVFFKKELALLKNNNLNFKEKDLLNKAKIAPIEVLAQLGNNYSAIGNTTLALDYFYKSESIAEKENLEFYKAVIPILIGGVKFKANNYKDALKEYKRGYKFLNETTKIDTANKRFNSSLTLISISNTYLKLNQLDSAKLSIKKGIEKGLDTINGLVRINFQSQIGRILLEEKKHNEALTQFLKLKKISDEYDINSGITYYYKDLSEAYTKVSQYDSAIAVMHKGIDIMKTKTKEFNLVEDYKALAKIYKLSGNIEKSNNYYEKYVLNQSILDKERREILTSFHNKEIENLASEKKIQQKNISYLAISGALIIALLLLFLFKTSKKNKKDSASFNELINKIQQLEEQQKIIDTKDKTIEEKSTLDINPETYQEILSGLKKLEEHNYFLKQDCNSYNVAKKIKTNTSYLSKVINAHYQKNFNTYINDLRINHAVLKLKENKQFRAYSIQSISEEIGYKSTDSFTKYFKRRTGLLPSVYIKKLNSIS